MQSIGTIQRSGEQNLRKFTISSHVLACKNVSTARGFLSLKWFTMGELFTSCFNFDLNRSASRKKMCSKMSIF